MSVAQLVRVLRGGLFGQFPGLRGQLQVAQQHRVVAAVEFASDGLDRGREIPGVP
jgi:hypothetical protein